MAFISYSRKVGKGRVTVGKSTGSGSSKKEPNPGRTKKIIIAVVAIIVISGIVSAITGGNKEKDEAVTTTTAVSTTVKATEPETVKETEKKSGVKVYITPDGEKYHMDKECAGDPAREIDIETARISRQPCQKCAQ